MLEPETHRQLLEVMTMGQGLFRGPARLRVLLLAEGSRVLCVRVEGRRSVGSMTVGYMGCWDPPVCSPSVASGV